ncbi:MAG: hypothetical protein ACYCY1_11055 [Sulfuriferula sp.]
MFSVALSSAWLSGCASAGLFSQGETAGYSSWNNSDEEVQNIDIVGIYPEKKQLILSFLRGEPYPDRRIQGFVGNVQYMSDTGHKVPEKVEVSWRKMPPPGGQPYTGKLMGPYQVVVRSRIPEQALRMARRDGYSLGINFSVGKLPILLCWGVVTKIGAGLLGTIMSGGQCNPEDVAWRKDIDWHAPGVWFPEKQ